MSDKGLDLPKRVTRFLVYNSDDKYLRYVFGRFGVYIESVVPIAVKSRSNVTFQHPTILLAKYNTEEQISLLLKDIDPRLQTKRLFKTMWRRKTDTEKIDAFICNCMKNLLHLAKGKSIRIICKDHPELQKRFYDKAVWLNGEEKTECSFDYDDYQVLFWIKRFDDAEDSVSISVPSGRVSKHGKTWFITGVEGLPVA